MPTTKTRKPKTAEAAPPVSNVPVFTKRNILTFQRYAKRRDLHDGAGGQLASKLFQERQGELIWPLAAALF